MPNKAFLTKKVLIALEMGSIDEKMLQFFDLITSQLGVEKIAAIHVLPDFEPYTPFPDEVVPADVRAAEEKERQEALRQLRRIVTERMPHLKEGQVDYHIEKGEPLKELLEKADETEAQLIVIGQETGTSHHDILARNLARYSDRHALIVPEVAKARLQHILVPVDFSENATRALRAAIEMRKRGGEDIRITVLNIYERPNLMAFKLDKTPEQMDTIIEKNHLEGMEKYLQETFPQEKNDLRTALVRRNRPGVAPFIMDYARDKAVDLIVVGAKGHSKVELLILGSVTERLLSQNRSIPTLIVR